MSGLFDAVVAGGDCARLKPYPDMIERALALSQTAPEEALMVGDSRNDALAARAAGVKALLVETGYNEGEPLAVWGPSNGFENIFPDAAAHAAPFSRAKLSGECTHAEAFQLPQSRGYGCSLSSAAFNGSRFCGKACTDSHL